MTVGAFHFDPLTVELDARFTKSKRQATLPLRVATAQELQARFQGKLPTAKAFKALPWETAGMLRDDLDAASIPYEDEQG